MGFLVVIPSRYESTRLPGKALVDICGKSLIEHVYHRAKNSQAERVIIATDDDRIREAAEAFGAEVCMTDKAHNSGTERIAQVIKKNDIPDNQVVVNVQGDEPMLPPELIDQVAQNLAARESLDMATLCSPVSSSDEMANPNIVKVVRDHQNHALFFSRAPIPWNRNLCNSLESVSNCDPVRSQMYKHIGIYAYRARFVRRYVDLPACPLEELECLEQLRVLYHGHNIHVGETQHSCGVGVDTPEDLEKVRTLMVSS